MANGKIYKCFRHDCNKQADRHRYGQAPGYRRNLADLFRNYGSGPTVLLAILNVWTCWLRQNIWNFAEVRRFNVSFGLAQFIFAKITFINKTFSNTFKKKVRLSVPWKWSERTSTIWPKFDCLLVDYSAIWCGGHCTTSFILESRVTKLDRRMRLCTREIHSVSNKIKDIKQQ